jgi:hypothetical protein
MIALRFVRLIETHAEEIAQGLLHKVLTSSYMSDMRKVPAAELQRRTHEIYRNLGDWLLHRTDQDIECTYTALARQRASQNVALSHFLAALLTTKEHLWEFLQSERLADQALDLFGELELLRQIDHFFDRALLYAARGYESEPLRPAGVADRAAAKHEPMNAPTTEVPFLKEELQVLVEIMEQRNRELIGEIARTEHAAFKHELRDSAQLLDAIETKLVKGGLRFTPCELDFFAEVIDRHDRELLAEIAHTDHREFKHMLIRKQAVLASARSRVLQACAMVA